MMPLPSAPLSAIQTLPIPRSPAHVVNNSGRSQSPASACRLPPGELIGDERLDSLAGHLVHRCNAEPSAGEDLNLACAVTVGPDGLRARVASGRLRSQLEMSVSSVPNSRSPRQAWRASEPPRQALHAPLPSQGLDGLDTQCKSTDPTIRTARPGRAPSLTQVQPFARAAGRCDRPARRPRQDTTGWLPHRSPVIQGCGAQVAQGGAATMTTFSHPAESLSGGRRWVRRGSATPFLSRAGGRSRRTEAKEPRSGWGERPKDCSEWVGDWPDSRGSRSAPLSTETAWRRRGSVGIDRRKTAPPSDDRSAMS
jgi:hypothetical protein